MSTAIDVATEANPLLDWSELHPLRSLSHPLGMIGRMTTTPTDGEREVLAMIAQDLAQAAVGAAATVDLWWLATPLGGLQWLELDGERRSWGRLDGDELTDDELAWLVERSEVAAAQRVVRIQAGSMAA